MSGIFLFISVFLLCIAALLYLAPQLKILNFVHYEAAGNAVRINRYAAARLLLPVIVFLACACIVEMRPELALPLLFPGIMQCWERSSGLPPASRAWGPESGVFLPSSRIRHGRCFAHRMLLKALVPPTLCRSILPWSSTMSVRVRPVFFSIGIFAAVGLLLMWYKMKVDTAPDEKPREIAMALPDIPPGEVRFRIDMYKPSNIPDSRHLLFMRKGDGTLRTWYFHVVEKQPVAPDGDDWSTPGNACEPFEIDPAGETIQCVVNDRENNRQLLLRWSWDGKSLGLLAPDLQPVPGEDRNGRFVFAAEAVDPAYLHRK